MPATGYKPDPTASPPSNVPHFRNRRQQATNNDPAVNNLMASNN
jgi:hypothetical protein